MQTIHASWAGALNEIGDACLADSARWFPNLHERGPVGLVVHYTLGLVGEVGELVDATVQAQGHMAPNEDANYPPTSDLAYELADVTIYLLDLGRALGVDLVDAVRIATTDPTIADSATNEEGTEDVLRHVGRIANAVKKLNRGDKTIAEVADAIGPTIGRMVYISIEHAEYFGLSLPAAIAAKHAVLEGRWG